MGTEAQTEKEECKTQKEESRYTAPVAGLTDCFQCAGDGFEILTAYILKCLHPNTWLVVTVFAEG